MSDESAVPELKKGTYLHTKSGRHYEVLGVAQQTETHEWMVVYRPLYETGFELFVRPYEMFIETVELGDQKKPRFQYVND